MPVRNGLNAWPAVFLLAASSRNNFSLDTALSVWSSASYFCLLRPPPSTTSSLRAALDVGGAQRRTGVAVHRPPGANTCCWQPLQSAWSGPMTPPCLCQVGQQLKTPTPAERWGIKPRRLVEGDRTGDCSRPLQQAPPRPSCQSPPSPPRQPGKSHTQRQGDEEKESHVFDYGFLCRIGCYFCMKVCVCVYGVRARSAGIVP